MRIPKYTVVIKPAQDGRFSSKRKAVRGAQSLANSWKMPAGVYRLVKVYQPKGKGR